MNSDDWHNFEKGWKKNDAFIFTGNIPWFAESGTVVYACEDDDYKYAHPGFSLQPDSQGVCCTISRLDIRRK